MRAQRLLFVRSPFTASLYPIYAAIVILLVLGLMGFAIALWPADSDSGSGRAGRVQADPPPSRSFEGAWRVPPERRPARTPMRSM